jgi:hypothetical protein
MSREMTPATVHQRSRDHRIDLLEFSQAGFGSVAIRNSFRVRIADVRMFRILALKHQPVQPSENFSASTMVGIEVGDQKGIRFADGLRNLA